MMRVGGNGPIPASVRYDIVPYTVGRGLDIGRGEYKAFPHFIGVREKSDDTLKDPVTPDFVVDSFDNLSEVIEGSLDFVFVHLADWSITDDVKSLLKIGGHFVVMTTDARVMVFRRVDTEEGGFELLAEKRPEKSALVIRYGAIGDMLQTGSILPELKRQGYHITLNCHVDGELIMRHDPHIDAFLAQAPNQVPNEELLPYWEHLASKYDHVINLCECVEGNLLLHPGRSNHRWPHAMRKKYCDKNYLEFMAEIAELPFHPEHHFYATEHERAEAERVIAHIGTQANPDWRLGQLWQKPFIIMWALAGSSVHKFYPHQDAVMARILTEMPNAHFILVGDPTAEILEAGWENEPRVHRYCGVMPIRDVLALAPMCQLVIGPETGVLNSVAFESVAKVVLLSHSTANNLTRDWVNTEAVASESTPCYPCHRLHYDHKFCPQDATTGAAMCQVDLAPSSVWDAVQRAYVGWGTVNRLTGATK